MVATPGISSGYWKARKMPRAARSSGAERQQVGALEQHLAAGHLVAGLAGQHMGKCRFAGAVRTHDGMDLAIVHGEVEALENLAVVNTDLKIFDIEQRHFDLVTDFFESRL